MAKVIGYLPKYWGKLAKISKILAIMKISIQVWVVDMLLQTYQYRQKKLFISAKPMSVQLYWQYIVKKFLKNLIYSVLIFLMQVRYCTGLIVNICKTLQCQQSDKTLIQITFKVHSMQFKLLWRQLLTTCRSDLLTTQAKN